MYLFYGCRRSDEDYLYKDEWPKYAAELKGKFNMLVAFSRENTKPDGSELLDTSGGEPLLTWQAKSTSRI